MLHLCLKRPLRPIQRIDPGLDRFHVLLQELAASTDCPVTFRTQTGERCHLPNGHSGLPESVQELDPLLIAGTVTAVTTA